MNLTLNIKRTIFYILIIDDDSSGQLFLRKAISKVIPQAIVESLYNVTETLRYVDKFAALPNLIFLNMNMTKISNLDTLTMIKKNAHLSKIPVITLSQEKNYYSEDNLAKLGINKLYAKPNDKKDLALIVEDVKNNWLV